jgi:hypothetical protein
VRDRGGFNLRKRRGPERDLSGRFTFGGFGVSVVSTPLARADLLMGEF